MQPIESIRKIASEIIRNQRLTRRRNDVEYAALIEQQLKRSLTVNQVIRVGAGRGISDTKYQDSDSSKIEFCLEQELRTFGFLYDLN